MQGRDLLAVVSYWSSIETDGSGIRNWKRNTANREAVVTVYTTVKTVTPVGATVCRPF